MDGKENKIEIVRMSQLFDMLDIELISNDQARQMIRSGKVQPKTTNDIKKLVERQIISREDARGYIQL